MFLRLISNLLSPPQCVFCRKALDVRSTHNVCGACAVEIPYNNGKKCSICSTALDISYGDLYCGVCKSTKRHFAQNISRYLYKDNVAAAIRRMKFGNGQLWAAKTLGDFLTQTVLEEYGDIDFAAVTFVPISHKRGKERGFNQSEIIAESVCSGLGISKAVPLLVKKNDTPRQSSLKLSERKSNVTGVFTAINTDFIADKSILLIDDILTTGATLDECSKTLKKAGAAAVYCATVASTQLK